MVRDGQLVLSEDEYEEDKLSLSDFLSDFSVAINDGETEAHKKQEENNPPESTTAMEDFEFLTCGGGGGGGGGLLSKPERGDMCAADEVFFQGLILPMRPSVSSRRGLLPASWGPSRCGSRSETLDRCYSASGFSSSRSSCSVSRSQSSRSSSSGFDAPRLSTTSNNFYTHPSPTPQIRRPRRSMAAGMKGTSSSPHGWWLLRLGVVKAPEMDLYDLRSNSSGGIGRRIINNDTKRDKKAVSAAAGDGKSSSDCTRSCGDGCGKAKKVIMRFLGRRCCPDSADSTTGGGEVPIARTCGAGCLTGRTSFQPPWLTCTFSPSLSS